MNLHDVVVEAVAELPDKMRISSPEDRDELVEVLCAALHGKVIVPGLTERVLRLVANYDNHDMLWWKFDRDEGAPRFFINCNDIFAWGCADCEEITPQNIDILEQSLKDAEDGGDILFVARVRGMRPQGAAYKCFSPELRKLFDAAGPERPVDFANPEAQPTAPPPGAEG